MSVIALLGKETTTPRRKQDMIAYVIALQERGLCM
jgi:hypothetical protein